MHSRYLFVLAVCLVACHAISIGSAAAEQSGKSSDRIQGVYEFVSETVELTEPKKRSGQRTPPEWTGQWQFQDGYFTSVLMKRRRDKFFESRNPVDLGFESFGGTYQFEGKQLRLTQRYSLHPLYVGRPLLVDYNIDGDKLILTQTLTPHIEDLTEGTVTIILRRLK